jgi:sortase A
MIFLGSGLALYPMVRRVYQRGRQQELIQSYLQGDMPSEKLLQGKEMLGVLWIPNADCQLPIFRGTEETVLKEGAGLLEGSSEISGEVNSKEGVHSVLCAHSGLPEGFAFDRIDALEKGDRIYIVSRKNILVYTVTQQLTVLPEEVHLLLQPSQFANEITLLTCTPYGINTHRLLVQAELSRFFGGSAA